MFWTMKKFLTFAVLALACIACKEDEDERLFFLEKDTIEFTSSGGNVSVTMTGIGEDAGVEIVSGNKDWLETSIEGRALSVTARRNISQEDRSTVLVLECAGMTASLSVVQYGRGELLNYADIKLFASQIAYKELERSQTKELNEKRSELQSVRQEIASVTDKANEAVELLDKINTFISSFRLFAPAIEEYANHVEADKTIEAGNSFRGILYEIGKLLETFKKLIKEGLCWFPRLMRWKTSKGEVAPVFIEKSNGYSYSVYGYMNVDTKEYYSKELMQREIKAGNRTGTVEQMDANVEAMARDLQEILRIGAEQKRLWEVYKGR